MKVKIFLGLVLVVIFALTTYTFLVYYYSTSEDVQVIHQPLSFQKKSVEKEDSWLSSLLKSPKSYAYPATEMKVNVNFKSLEEKSDSTELVVKNLDDYKFFCLNEVLKEKEIEYAYEQAGNLVNIIIYLPNKGSRKEQIIQELKYYEIQYTIQ